MGLQTRLLAGLAVLVFVAIASTGWLSLQVARGGLDAAEEERARVIGETAAGVMGAAVGRGGLGDAGVRERLRLAEQAITGAAAGGIEEARFVDAQRRTLDGKEDADPGFAVTLGGGGTLARRSGGVLSVYAPIRSAGGGSIGAVRLRVGVGRSLGEAVSGSTRLLLALTLVDGGLILLFGALFLRGVLRPVEELSAAAQEVARGRLDVAPVSGGSGEVAALADAFNQMTASLREQQAHLAASREQLLAQEKLASVGRLAAGVAHEVGNPLTAVLGYVELLLRDEKEPESCDLLERVRTETGRIHRIVHDLLDYARPEAQSVEPVDLRAVAATAVDLLRPQPRFRDVAVELRLPDDLPRASSSSSRLVQVLLNLLLNAADAMHGTGRIVVRRAPDDHDPATVALEIADEGPGVPEAERARIFDPFFTTKEPGAGTGLGLALCRSIARAYHGDVTLIPSSQGAVFRLTLPRFPPSHAQPSADRRPPSVT